MCIRNRLIMLLAILVLLVSSCQSTPRTSDIVEFATPHVPVVVGKTKVKNPSSPGGIVVNARTGYVYIANTQEVAVLKGTDVIKEIQTGGGDAKSMVVDEANGLVYVVNSDKDTVTVIQDTEVVGTVPTVGKNPSNIAIEPRSGLAYAVSGYRSRPFVGESVGSDILVLDSTRVVDNLKVSGRVLLTEIVSDLTNGYIYAGGGKIVIVFKALQEVARHNLKESVDSMAVNPRTGEVYVLASQTLYRFKESKLIDSVELPPGLGNTWQIRVQPLTGAVYIPHSGYVPSEGRILVVREMKAVADIQVGALATLGIDPLFGNVYVGNHTGRGKDVGTVMVVNDTKVWATYRMEWLPYSIGVNPANGWGYVFDGTTITVLGYPQNKLTVPAQTETIPVTPKIHPTPVVYP